MAGSQRFTCVGPGLRPSRERQGEAPPVPKRKDGAPALFYCWQGSCGTKARLQVPVWKSNFGRPTPSTRRRPRNCICSMAWSFHAIDTRMPPFLRLLDGVQVDNLTHCLISTQASTGGCGRRGCWRALRVLRILMITGGRTRWRRTGRRRLMTRVSRSNWPATASPQIQVSPHTYLASRTRRRSTPGALILDRGALILDRFWPCTSAATATARSLT